MRELVIKAVTEFLLLPASIYKFLWLPSALLSNEMKLFITASLKKPCCVSGKYHVYLVQHTHV